MFNSRLIIKNLPNSTTEAKLRDHFSEKGNITDVQLKKTPDGTFRHFAFVGFKSDEEADSARLYFDGTYFGASRIRVESCLALNDPNKPRPWSKQSKEKEEGKKRSQGNKVSVPEEGEPKKKKKRKEEELFEKAQQDPDFLEFLEVHSKDNAKWGNDTVLDALSKLVSNDKKSTKQKSRKLVDEDADDLNSDDEGEGSDQEKEVETTTKPANKGTKKKVHEHNYLYVKLRNLPKKAKKGNIKSFFVPVIPKSIRLPSNNRGFAYVGFNSESDLNRALSKHRSILLGNQISVKKYTSEEDKKSEEERRFTIFQDKHKQDTEFFEPVGESGRLFVRNLSYNVTEDELKPVFEKYGPVTEVHVPVDRLTRKIKGFAFISYLLPEHAVKAMEALDGSSVMGRMLHILQANSKDEVKTDDPAPGSSYKRDKQQKMKKTAGSSHNWNALFLGQNAVSAVVSEKYGVSREQLLLDNNDQRDDRLSSVAVRMALAETEIVSETKKFLEQQGVCLDAFELVNAKAERSSTAILVKNLVANTTEDELREVFEKHGVLGRVVLPPSGVTAIVEYMVPAEARAGFKKLAYSKFKSMPLYLEWAPVGCFRVAADGSKISLKQDKTAEDDSKTPVSSTSMDKSEEIKFPTYEDEEPFDENMIPEPDTTLFVKNLNFTVTEEDLKKHFSFGGRVFAATVARRKDPKHSDQLLSQGFGFVQFYFQKDAKKALNELNQSMLQNHLLELKMSSRTLESENRVVNPKDHKGTKLLVRNVPFQATEEEVTDLFKVFGKLKAVRMPKKLVGESQHRGFAFIEFFIEANAKAAFDTLSKSTHMYGRRLVLEWAQKDESVDELREKVAKKYNLQVTGGASGSSGSTKKQMRRYFESQQGSSKTEGEDVEED